MEFERPLEVAPTEMDPLEKEEFEWKQKKRALGNIRFIGELFKGTLYLICFTIQNKCFLTKSCMSASKL